MSKIKKVLVTGGSGFIGSHVVDELRDRGYEVTIFDHYGKKPHRDDVDVFLGDTRDQVAVTEAVAVHDGVIHLAGVLGTQETINNPLPAVQTNIIGGLNVFQAVKQYGKPCVYIAVGNHWMNNSYSISKTTAERFALMFNKEHGTRIAVVRGLNAYGPRQKQLPVKKIMPNFIIPALMDEEITVYGDGSQVMDMIYVKDLAQILVDALVKDHGCYDKIFEAGTGRVTTVKQIAEIVVEQVGKGKINYVPMRPGEPDHSVVLGDPDTLAPLGIEPSDLLPLEEGIRETIAYYEQSVKSSD